MANELFINPGADIVFAPSGGDVLFTPTSVANGAGRISDRADLGAFPRADRYRWYAETALQAGASLNKMLSVFLPWWNDDTPPGADPDGDVGAVDAAFSGIDNLGNLKKIGPIIVTTTSAGSVLRSSGLVTIPVRYVSVVWWNATDAALSATAGDHKFVLKPVPYQYQAA